ncbi:hypothetical protein SAMN02745245_01589 [Anaerosphaera aminiphila DSM 21120]|uniref:Uncharacterized protein n=1 Tax=Anaerosphaera aminiphila DSM 21120 TaxID=1120995 RepID=A0A1M5TVY4_9FIRM|nr:hypothetical protein [Anaerosphaera aminiphila]SHH54858.1 hypothetical protein SAMN02745245_01589 [Anaerosphaera aminiphila DSM 21120]
MENKSTSSKLVDISTLLFSIISVISFSLELIFHRGRIFLEIGWITFAIFQLILNASIYFNTKKRLALTITWIFILLLELFFLIWR